MKKLCSVLIMFTLFCVLCSCRFQKPLIKFPMHSYTKKDTISGVIERSDWYSYPRISWHHGPRWKGLYAVNSSFDADSNLTKRIITWRPNTQAIDGDQKLKRKVLYYTAAEVTRIDYMINKMRVDGRISVLQKSVDKGGYTKTFRQSVVKH